MHLPRGFEEGDRGQFAVRFAFLRDPDLGRAATPEQSLSWGKIEVWANGHNVCRHIEDNQTMDAVHWYLLPILQWLSSNWDFLLHEERFPDRSAARDAWTALERSAEPPLALADDEAEKWDERWQQWRQRHSLAAAREGGLVPNLCIRRWRDLIELSWGDRPIAGAPCGFRFDANHGSARFAPDVVAQVLYAILDGATQHLHDALPASAVFQRLRDDVQRLKTTNSRRRKGLVSGFRHDLLTSEEGWKQIEELFPATLDQTVREAILGADENELVIKGPSQAALMFGSLSPSLDDADSRLLAAKLVEHFDQRGDAKILGIHVRDVPVEGGGRRAWQQGYSLAEQFLIAHGKVVGTRPIDMDQLLSQLGVIVEEIELHDSSIRAVALAGPKHQPTVMINSKFKHQQLQPRRFTLAHELCHILHDRTYGARLALASGPWAPVDVEKRANAFAAMLLMPAGDVASVVGSLTRPLDSPQAVWEVAKSFQTSFSATLEHLCNLGHLDEETRDELREEMAAAAKSSTGVAND